MDIVVLGGFVVLFVLISCILAIISFVRISGIQRQVAQLKAEWSAARTVPDVLPVSKVKKVKVEQAEPLPVEKPAIAMVTPSPPTLQKAEPKRDIEQALASRWFVWIGGAAVALAGLLLIKYAHDHGLIPPALRVVLGLIFAAGLVAGGEYVRRVRSVDVVDYVPAALSSAGLVTTFGSVYSAYALYDLIPSGLAFIGLGFVALGAFALSRLQGPLIAALGLLGGYVAPMFVTADDPNAWGFFPYIFAIVAASFSTMRGRDWWWLGYGAIAGAVVWSLLWINGGAFETADVWPVGLFAIALGTAATLLVDGRHILSDKIGSLFAPQNMSHSLRLASCGMVAASMILATQVFASAHSFPSLLLFAIGMSLIVYFSWMKIGWSGAVLLSAALSFMVLMGWQDVSTQNWAMDESGMWSTVPGFISPTLFRNWMFFALAGFGGIGAVGYLRKAIPQPWAMLAAGASFLFLFGSWARADFVMRESIWAALSVALFAGLMMLAFKRRVNIEQISAGALLIGAALLGLFAVDRMFDDVWLTISIALLAAGFAYLSRLLPVDDIGLIASSLGTFAAGRLFVSREFWGDRSVLPLGEHWPLYGYGITAALLWWGSRQLSAQKYRQFNIALEGISLGLVISLVSKELRTLIGGGLEADHMTLLEMSAHILAWLGAACGLAYRQHLFSSFVSLWGSRILLAVSVAAILGMSLVSLNPLATGEIVEGNTLVNTLWLAYLAPVGLLAFMARKMESLGWSKWRNAVGVLALVLVVAFVTLQTKRIFQGRYFIPEFSSDAESYALSAAWLVTAVGLFIAGLKLDRQAIRYGGMAVMVLALLKTFAYDLWQLGGLWQIASVMGIGLSLIGIGWLYTRFVKQGLA
jgi:uncharacterized membrane protein